MTQVLAAMVMMVLVTVSHEVIKAMTVSTMMAGLCKRTV